jgi:hypothetical protein
MDSDPIKILITGDLCPHYRIEKLVLQNDFKSVFNDFIDVFQGNDLNITDLECPLTLSDKSRKKIGPHQKAHPKCIEILKYANIKLAALANNHIMDYGSTGVSDTLEVCRENEIDTVGIGNTPNDAEMPYIFKIKSRQIAIFNYADNEFLSTPGGTFYCNPLNSIQCFYDIKSARQNNDHIIIILHAGNEFYELPSPRTKKLYRYLIDLGADAVISHHTHAFSGFEIFNSKPIFYGLGNFIYDWPGRVNTEWNRGFVVRLLLSESIDFEIIPLKQGNENPGLFHLSDEEKIAFNKRLSKLNSIIADDVKLENAFRDYCRKVAPMYDAYIEPYFGRFLTALRKRGLFPRLMNKNKRRLLLNITRCESHRDVLLRLLKQYE